MAHRRILPLILLVLGLAAPVSAEEIDQKLAQARQAIQTGHYDEAIRLLDEALPHADSLPAEVQNQARTAIHFYSALAHSSLKHDDEAIEHLQEVLRISPEISSVDPAKYDRHFVELFNRAKSETGGEFDALYPVISTPIERSVIDPASWGGRPALEILGSRAERREWQNAVGDEERDRFIANFWAARDETPGTERNEFREKFQQRVEFADAVFTTGTERGAFTDRGRVYVLLGEPAHVRRRAISSRDNLVMMNVGAIGIEVGTIEFWFYNRDQLPIDYAKPTVTYRFVSHQGVGDAVLQKDGIPMNILAMAASANRQ